MALERKRDPEIIPQYSLTGDLLSYLRCGLQYRYQSGSQLPPSRPVQLWFGEFIHGVMEGAFRVWNASDSKPAFPWPCTPTPYRQPAPDGRLMHDLGTIGETVEGTLRARGKIPRSSDVRDAAYRRAERAVNELGPALFPLISVAEQRVIGTRQVPLPQVGAGHRRATRYELHGVVDVLTNISLGASASSNFLRQAIQQRCPTLSGNFEVIVDYKGSRRPPTDHPYWDQGSWQVQTYAWLRMRQPGAPPVAAGVLLYINELDPSSADTAELKREIRRGAADVFPSRGTADSQHFDAWRPGNVVPNFSMDYRLARTIRVIPVDPQSQQVATSRFDQTVLEIEQRVAAEANAGTIIAHWDPCGDEETCAACDFRHFCPTPYPRNPGYVAGAPTAP